MAPSVRFCLVLHNHQPIGNFDHVFAQAYEDSYWPFLEAFEPYADLRITLHTSGPLMEWLDANRPEYLDRLAALVQAGRVEIIGGPYSEPILTMIPSRDRIGQIRRYTKWLNQRLGATVRGMWTPERVWEQSATRDVADAGIEYTILDDFHFRSAGLRQDELAGYYITEDDGRLISVFPGSERLRYLIPFKDPSDTVAHLRELAERFPNPVAVFGDDGEKFGTWPETKKHVYEDGWLRRFFDALSENKEWLHATTLADSVDSVPPIGKVYLPDASYREMTEWVLPVEQHHEYEQVRHDFQEAGTWDSIEPFVSGGFWRNFKTRYPESNEMYCRMMMVSRRLQQARENGATGSLLEQAEQALYRGQCNCSYWHGAFGGIYLPHLRNAVFEQLIQADNMLDELEGRQPTRIEATVDDFNLDSRQEVSLNNDKYLMLVDPANGGHIYEFDIRSISHNLLATMTRRPEAYHRKVLQSSTEQGGAESIHDRVVFKQEGLDEALQYDTYSRKSLVDHFFEPNVSLEEVQRGRAAELGDFVQGRFDARVRRNPNRIQIQLSREGWVGENRVKLTKGITGEAGSSQIEVAYFLEGLPYDRTLQFAVEWNFAGLPAGADDRFFYGHDRERLGHLGESLNRDNQTQLGLVDEWLGIDNCLSVDRPTQFWTFPIASVSQSEGGFELVHQSVAVIPHWLVEPDAEGRWAVTMTLNVDTSLAEQRLAEASAVAT